ncbi:hypothetical protein INR49_028002 [Caranx melampygus]|nr:hypothetical protein INR49_028002 [Caranx melampygus]
MDIRKTTMGTNLVVAAMINLLSTSGGPQQWIGSCSWQGLKNVSHSHIHETSRQSLASTDQGNQRYQLLLKSSVQFLISAARTLATGPANFSHSFVSREFDFVCWPCRTCFSISCQCTFVSMKSNTEFGVFESTTLLHIMKYFNPLKRGQKLPVKRVLQCMKYEE